MSAFYVCSCAETGRDYVTIELEGRGEEARTIAVEGGSLRLTSASVAIGPLYLCATESAEIELCETALAELLETASFDVLQARPVHLGTLHGTTGTVRSGFFDYGITWLLTKPAPRANRGAVRGHSARLSFEARADDGKTLEVQADMDITPLGPGDAAMNGQKTQHEIAGDEDRLTIEIDANRWLRRVRLTDLLALDADGDGQVRLAKDTQAYEAILQGMTVNAPPRLEW